MISSAPVSCPPHAWRGNLSLKQQAFSLCKRSLSSFGGSNLTSSFRCECLLDGDHHQSALASKAEAFIEHNLTGALSGKAGSVRQIVLLTDGEDLVPCRLQWPPLSLIFQVSSRPVIQVLEVPKSCLVRYIYGELEEWGWTDGLRNVGYQGTKPSAWLIQGLNLEAETKFQRILANISGLMMQGSLLIGALKTNILGSNEDGGKKLLEKMLLGCGFCVRSATTSDGRVPLILFVAEQLRLSDDQVAYAMKEMELAEETGDEETFEDWL